MTASPRDESDLVAAIGQAAASRTPLAIEGAGTRRSVGRPMQTSQTLSLASLSGITLYEPAEMVIGAKAGTPLREIEATLAAKGQRLSFEPPDLRLLLGADGEPTIGGVAATNASGPRRIQQGAARDSLIGVRAVNGSGVLVKSGGRVMKNVTGLDLVKLLSGSWGTLAVLSEVIFKVLPVPEHAATVVLHGLDEPRAIAAMAAALGSPYDITGAAHLPGSVERVPKTLIRLEGFAPSVAERIASLRTILKPFGACDVLDGEAAATLWDAVRDARFVAEPRDRAVWRISVAPSKAPALRAAIAAAGVAIERHLFDWGGGLLWLSVPAGTDAGAAGIRPAVAAAGGHALLVRATPEIRAAVAVFEPEAPAIAALTRRIKASFDPAGLLNPGRMYPGL